MIPLYFEAIYATEARPEACSAAIALRPGELQSAARVRVYDETGLPVPTQARVTARHPDGSARWLFVRFIARVPAMRSAVYRLSLEGGAEAAGFPPLAATPAGIDAPGLSLRVSERPGALFESIACGGVSLGADAIGAPELTDAQGDAYDFSVERWEVAECGEVCAALRAVGWHSLRGERRYKGEIAVTAWRDSPAFELRYRLVNTSAEPLAIGSLTIAHRRSAGANPRSAVGVSNYKTRTQIGEGGAPVSATIDDQFLLYEANEHNAEVFFGTFFADCTDETGGLCATIYQAQQNYPKAFSADANGWRAMLVPQGVGSVTMQGGMARETRLLIHPHASEESLEALADASTRYQMPNRPRVEPEAYARSGVLEDVFTQDPDVGMFLEAQADAHARCYGMLNWGDSPDAGYTAQGRGGGALVWTNNEYDYPHACALLYAQTGVRRYLDYLLVSARHWLDVDICHYSDDPLLLGGQWEHTAGHCIGGRVMCSHQWVEGLLDYYHFTGDEEALRAAVGIGEVDLRLLDTPQFKTPGETTARETGWALRAFVALYKETNDERWLAPCDRIVSHFAAWEERYGLWLSPYMDNTRIRVVFMISVAVASLMRYYRVRPQERVRGMILRAVDDLLSNARLPNGLFYYKELPSLKRFGNNPLVLEALAIAYELTGDAKYLRAGLPTLRYVMGNRAAGSAVSAKRVVGDAVVCAGPGTKGFAQLMLPVASFSAACCRAGLSAGH